jgi:hypothetical protein
MSILGLNVADFSVVTRAADVIRLLHENPGVLESVRKSAAEAEEPFDLPQAADFLDATVDSWLLTMGISHFCRLLQEHGLQIEDYFEGQPVVNIETSDGETTHVSSLDLLRTGCVWDSLIDCEMESLFAVPGRQVVLVCMSGQKDQLGAAFVWDTLSRSVIWASRYVVPKMAVFATSVDAFLISEYFWGWGAHSNRLTAVFPDGFGHVRWSSNNYTFQDWPSSDEELFSRNESELTTSDLQTIGDLQTDSDGEEKMCWSSKEGKCFIRLREGLLFEFSVHRGFGEVIIS